MKNTSLFFKALSLVFALAIVAGCSSTETTDSGEEAAAAAAEREAAERAAAEAAAAGEADRMKQEAMAAMGKVIYFDFDDATLRPDSKAILDQAIAALKNTTNNIRLEGHCDERGTREYNMALGERRANSVANYMVVNGVARYRIETVSYGEERPVGMGHDESSWGENRRVEIKLN